MSTRNRKTQNLKDLSDSESQAETESPDNKRGKKLGTRSSSLKKKVLLILEVISLKFIRRKKIVMKKLLNQNQETETGHKEAKELSQTRGQSMRNLMVKLKKMMK